MNPVSGPLIHDNSGLHIDQSAVRTHQALLVLLLIVAYILNAWWLVAFASLMTLIGAVVPPLNLSWAIYFRILKPFGIAKADLRQDSLEPYLFAQGLGGAVAFIAMLALLSSAATLGWALCGFVVVMATINLSTGKCVGVVLYKKMNRSGGIVHRLR